MRLVGGCVRVCMCVCMSDLQGNTIQPSHIHYALLLCPFYPSTCEKNRVLCMEHGQTYKPTTADRGHWSGGYSHSLSPSP